MSTSCAIPGCPTRPPDVWPLCEAHLGDEEVRLALARLLRAGSRTDVTLIALEWLRHRPDTLEEEALAVTRLAELKLFAERLEPWHAPSRDW